MKGCITCSFRVLGCLGLVVLLVVGWLYRDRLGAAWRTLTGHPAEVTKAAPGAAALESARGKLNAVTRGRADSVVLTAAETASLVREGLTPAVRDRLDSLQVTLLDGGIRVGADVETGGVAHELLGPLAFFLSDRQRVQVAGPVRGTSPGHAAWTIERMEIHHIPIPTDAVNRFVSHALGRTDTRTVPLTLPAGVRAVHIRPSGTVLVGTRAR
ncbi:MAG TPA: hypothetical protein VFW66_14745 [Gemmatimonadales bacterium]|nr:hypothetical protein [Gemmatimonadales bacterium]